MTYTIIQLPWNEKTCEQWIKAKLNICERHLMQSNIVAFSLVLCKHDVTEPKLRVLNQ